MKKLIFSLAAGLLLCFLGDVFTEGLIFSAVLIIFFSPFIAYISPAVIALGGLLSGCAVYIGGNSPAMLWGLLVLSMVGISLFSLWRTALLGAVALPVIRLDIPGQIYIPLFFAVIFGTIFFFTFEKKRDIMFKTIPKRAFERDRNYGKEILR